MNKLSRNELFSIGINLDLPDLVNWCMGNELANEKVCKENDIWYYKLKEFPDYEKLKLTAPPKTIYFYLYNLKKLKEKLNLNEDVYTLFKMKKLELNRQKIKEIPKEIGNMFFLEKLSLIGNNINDVPIELNNIPKLKEIDLTYNPISKDKLQKIYRKGLVISYGNNPNSLTGIFSNFLSK